MEHVSLSIINILRKGVEAGRWTVDNLDTPSAGWTANTRVDRRTFPGGYTGKQHRNLLREAQPSERVEVVSPRDFSTPLTEPGQELDGVTVYTNQNPLDLNNLPF